MSLNCIPQLFELNQMVKKDNKCFKYEKIVKILNDIKLFFHQQLNLNRLIAYNIGYISDEI